MWGSKSKTQKTLIKNPNLDGHRQHKGLMPFKSMNKTDYTLESSAIQMVDRFNYN